MGDDLVRAAYLAFSGYHTGLYRDLHEQLGGGAGRGDVSTSGQLIARVSAGFEPFVRDMLTRIVRERHPRRVLNVGCGSGQQLASMLAAAPHASGIGVELDAAAAALAEHTLEQRGLAHRARVLRGDVMSVTSTGSAAIGGPVDLVLLANVIYYVPAASRAAFLRRLRDLLAPGGTLLVITTTATPALFSRHFDLLLRAQEGTMELPELGALRDQVRDAGLTPQAPRRIAPGEPLYAVLAVNTAT